MRLCGSGLSFITALVLTLATAVPGLAQVIDGGELRFRPESRELAIRDTVTGRDSIEYTFEARARQGATISLRASNPQAYFNLIPPRGEEAIHNGSVSGNEFRGMLPQSGVYRIQVYLMRAAAGRDEMADYTLHLGLTGTVPAGEGDDLVIRAPDIGRNAPAGRGALPDDDYVWHVQGLRPGDTLAMRSGAGPNFRVIAVLEEGMPLENLGCMDNNGGFWCRVATVDRPRISGWVNGRYLSDEAGGPIRDREIYVPGTRYHAVGPLSCQFPGDPRMAGCNYGVVRNGPFAQIDIMLPNGDTRSLDYRAGRFTSRDGADIRSRKQGGDAVVTIDGGETYYIPDDVMMGE